ncbi:MAG: hypothetical protein H6718_26410 [Polyangiaceae bacterium]|nr:hypothetical protein [Polyangiaceae bacterium]MCB9610347.1 hypothetical protein [Polyangiaceae bacterium]
MSRNRVWGLGCLLCVALSACTSGNNEAEPTRCGQLPCDGECCDEACSVCMRSGDVCEEMCVIGRCSGLVAQAVGECNDSLGFRWTGSGCEELIGCTCEGTHCFALYASLDACESYNAECVVK